MFSVKTAVIALSVATWVGWGEASAQDAVHSSAKPSVVILPFSVLGHEGASALPLPSNPCAASSDTSPPTQNEAQALNAALASGLPGKLTNTTAQQLGAQDRMNVYKRLQDAPASALIVAGCVKRPSGARTTLSSRPIAAPARPRVRRGSDGRKQAPADRSCRIGSTRSPGDA